MDPEPLPQLIASLERPCPALWKYYILTGLFSGPAIVITKNKPRPALVA